MSKMASAHAAETSKTIRKIRLFTVGDFDKEEAFLHEMSLQGYHLVSYTKLCVYTFAQGEPRNYYYSVNYQPGVQSRSDYLQMFADGGWEYITRGPAIGGSWDYFRKESTAGEVPTIFTDAPSKIEAFKRIRNTWTILGLVLFVGALPGIILAISRLLHGGQSTGDLVFSIALLALWVFIIGVYSSMFVKLTRVIREERSSV